MIPRRGFGWSLLALLLAPFAKPSAPAPPWHMEIINQEPTALILRFTRGPETKECYIVIPNHLDGKELAERTAELIQRGPRPNTT